MTDVQLVLFAAPDVTPPKPLRWARLAMFKPRRPHRRTRPKVEQLRLALEGDGHG